MESSYGYNLKIFLKSAKIKDKTQKLHKNAARAVYFRPAPYQIIKNIL